MKFRSRRRQSRISNVRVSISRTVVRKKGCRFRLIRWDLPLIAFYEFYAVHHFSSNCGSLHFFAWTSQAKGDSGNKHEFGLTILSRRQSLDVVWSQFRGDVVGVRSRGDESGYGLAADVLRGRESGNVMGVVSLRAGVFGNAGPQALGFLRSGKQPRSAHPTPPGWRWDFSRISMNCARTGRARVLFQSSADQA